LLLVYFFIKNLMLFCHGLPLDLDLPTSASGLADIIGMYHHTLL
jgi:hypothetical protein